jgi:hypothetical protein
MKYTREKDDEDLCMRHRTNANAQGADSFYGEIVAGHIKEGQSRDEVERRRA